MKSIYDMNGIERAAALLVALGPKTASDILKHLDEDSIEKITTEIVKIEQLDPVDREDLVGSFIIELRKAKKSIKGGEDKARELLIDSFGPERAEEIIQKINVVDPREEFEYLNSLESSLLLTFIKDEQPQTIAVVLNYISSDRAGSIMNMLPREVSREVAVKLARMKEVTPEAASAIARIIKKKYDQYRKNNSGSMTAGGLDTLIGIMRHMPAETEQKIMSNLDVNQPGLSRDIREKIFTFENIANLTNNEMRILIDEINDDRRIAKALKGAGDDIRFKFLRNMSQNRATDVLQDMDDLGTLRLSEVEESRGYIVDVLRYLHDNGIISLTRDKEIYVE